MSNASPRRVSAQHLETPACDRTPGRHSVAGMAVRIVDIDVTGINRHCALWERLDCMGLVPFCTTAS